jgi:predicted PurR-regulated permease PerM
LNILTLLVSFISVVILLISIVVWEFGKEIKQLQSKTNALEQVYSDLAMAQLNIKRKEPKL